jgi:hypothetical protein
MRKKMEVHPQDQEKASAASRADSQEGLIPDEEIRLEPEPDSQCG